MSTPYEGKRQSKSTHPRLSLYVRLASISLSCTTSTGSVPTGINTCKWSKVMFRISCRLGEIGSGPRYHSTYSPHLVSDHVHKVVCHGYDLELFKLSTCSFSALLHLP